MKKTYINPTIRTHKVVINNLLATLSSGLQSTTPAGQNRTGSGPESTYGNGGDGLSKESTWGLDWGE